MFNIHVRALCGVARGMDFRLSAFLGGGTFSIQTEDPSQTQESPSKDCGSPSKKGVINDHFLRGGPLQCQEWAREYSAQPKVMDTKPSQTHSSWAQAHQI